VVAAILCAAVGVQLHAQARPLRTDLGAAGASYSITENGRTWYVQQAVGQAGVAGSTLVDGRYFNQGFVQPHHATARHLPSTDLAARIFPNPFDDRFTVAFAEDPEGPVQVYMYNALGQVVYAQVHGAARSITITPAGLAMGAYVVHVQVGHRRLAAQLQRFR
jgi:hypothetical protein